ncbi:UBX domain-containing protein 10 [Brachyistius frenatus]|uniref:UBX domain-containing protein 10 n=1 Tax=Brachyistius frenatus TaxID=100188 RepID=UPI0037E98AAD
MHLTRPKSSKGRSRPAASGSRHAADDTDGVRGPPEPPPARSGPDGDLRSRSQPVTWRASQLSPNEVLRMLQRAPAAPAAPRQSLNKYKVLPSIEGRRSGASPGGSLDQRVSQLCLCDGAANRTCGSSEGDARADGPPRSRPEPPAAGAGAGGGALLLAVRAPCGGRFQQHFDPSDTLLAVRASAEVRYGAEYGDAVIETMDVPRRTFTDLDMTLAQCGIPNRSLLCISQSSSVLEHE